MNVYKNLRDDNGNIIAGRTKFFVEKNDKEGNILGYQSGVTLVPENSGTLFILDDWIIGQVNKLQLIDGHLCVKDGETLEEPVKSEKELQREELLRQLAELDAVETPEGE